MMNKLKLSALFLCTCLFTTGWAASRDTVAIQELLKTATSLQRVNDDSCYRLAKKAWELSRQADYPNGIRGACIRIGTVLFTRGFYDSAQTYLFEARRIALELHDPAKVAGADILIGYTYNSKGMRDSTYASLYEAMHYLEKAPDNSLAPQVYNTLGNFSFDYHDYAVALQNYKKGLQLAIQANNRYEQITALIGIGNIYYQGKKYAQALIHYKLADSINILLNDPITRAQNLGNIALSYTGLKQYDLALRTYTQALSLIQNQGMQGEEATHYYNMGCLFEETGKPDQAIRYYQMGLTKSREIGDANRIADSYKTLARMYALKNDFANAYRTHLLYAALSDSLLSVEKINSISEMQTRFETEKKEKEIERLNIETTLRSKQRNAWIAGAVAMLLFAAVLAVQRQKVNRERKKSDNLLKNILPAEVAEELKKTGSSLARQYNNVTVMFTDFVNFTGISETMGPAELVEEINRNFTAFDRIIEKHGLEKIKTIGDAYLAVCGLPNETPDHAQRVIRAALEIRDYMKNQSGKFNIRIGIHSGPVVAGIVGVKKYAYDIWGDTVNTAARMEQHSESGKVNISGPTFLLAQESFTCKHRGKIQAKNKGEIDMYFVESGETR